jgi:hypothetical protein
MRGLIAAGLAFAAFAAFAATATVPPSSVAEPMAVYRLYVAGIPIGSAGLSVTVAANRYVIDGTADFGFLFWGGRGGARAEGSANGHGWQPDRYRLAYEGVRRPGGVEIDFEGGKAVRVHSFPPPPEDVLQGRVELTEEHLRNVLDPLTALVVPAGVGADPSTICRRLLPVFSGFTRFNLALEGPRTTTPDLGCAARYVPVAGHRPDSRSVARMTQPGAFEIALAPITPEAWAPARVAVETRFGTFEMIRQR